ncbi:MAG: heme exporter protein CcmD [Phreatobacter sp.]|uniref:heme exporter protein CcmD n=1 Tax=Phreatobacter sp. TaxID=1966341 RepID=UPI001A459092|nr:heme exporter protein CcmD [Phreatobacter sp.]MBL8571239.1 heme exporter protein CcmD [Phreatobacter sp.]
MNDPHAFFILASYAITALTCLGLIGWVVLDHRRQTAVIADLEARGVTRRSGRSS